MKTPCEDGRDMVMAEEGKAPASLLRRLFEELSAAGVHYCVMRNYDRLPDSVGQSDVDILLKCEQLGAAEEAVRKAVSRSGGCVVAKVKNRSVYLKTMGCEQRRWWGLAVDLIADVDYKGMVYMPTDEILMRSTERKGVRVADRDDVAMMALAKEVIYNLCASAACVREARRDYREVGDRCLRCFEWFGDDVHSRLLDFLRRDLAEPSRLEDLGRAMRRDLERRQGAGLIRYRMKELEGRLVRIARRPGSVIVVTGTDGAGKSTLLDQLRPVLQRAFHKRVHYEHLRPHWLPDLGVAAGRRKRRPEAPVENPHEGGADGFLKSLFRAGYYWIDYSFGFFAKICPLLVGRCHLVCFDRYAIDVIMDPRRMRIGLPPALLKLVLAFAPRPDLVLCLGGDPEIIYQRKPETSLDEVTRQTEFLRDYAERHPRRAAWIDTTGTLEGSVEAAFRAIMTRLAERAG